MDDLISRRAAIDALAIGAESMKRILDDPYIFGNAREKFEWGLDVIEAAITDIKDLPSAQPEPIKINIDHELTKDEYERLRKDMADAPIVLFSSAQSEVILCKDCKQFIDHRCVKADHYVSGWGNCMDVFGAERREE